MNPITKTLLATLLLLFVTTGIMAQDKYEYATVYYNPSYSLIDISTTGGELKNIVIPKGGVRSKGDMTPALKEVDAMTEQGWEFFNTAMSNDSQGYPTYVFSLRKKKQ